MAYELPLLVLMLCNYSLIVAQLKCTFEKNLCNWKQSKADNFDWTRRKGKTPSFGTGPSQSSTGKNGMTISFILISYLPLLLY